jgi:hypothetical protein
LRPSNPIDCTIRGKNNGKNTTMGINTRVKGKNLRRLIAVVVPLGVSGE